MKRIQDSQRSFALENKMFAPTFPEMGGLNLEHPTRYTYYMGKDKLLATNGPAKSLPANVETYVSKENFQVVAVANIDQDETLDVWVITEKGDPENIVNDVRD